MRQLHHVDPEVVSAVTSELSERGYTDFLLQLARQIYHPDPFVRRRVAETLPGMNQIDPLPWLKELAQDKSPQVREIARAILSTNRDPGIKAWLKEHRR